MSSLLQPTVAGPNQAFLQGNDESACAAIAKWYTNRRHAPWTDGRLWPNSRGMSGDSSVPMFPLGNDALQGMHWAEWPEEQGNEVMKKISGLTKDKDGNPLGGVIVQGYLTSNDLFLRELVSDAGGYYEFCSEYSGANHYLVGYKAGGVDVVGTTVNTLVPA